jgi:hypothetical protein
VEHEIGEEEQRRRLTAVDRGAPAKYRAGKRIGMRCARGDRRKKKFTGRIPELKRGTRVGGKQLLAVDGARGSSGGQCRNASARGGASGVVKRRAGELGPRWRRKSCEGATGGR